MSWKKAFLILQAVLCALLAVLLAAGAIGIYREGAAARALNPLESIYTPELVAEKLGSLIPLILLLTVLSATGIVLGIRDPRADRPAEAPGPVEHRGNPGREALVRKILLAAAAVLIVLGILNGSAYDVLVKAIHICTECVGLG